MEKQEVVLPVDEESFWIGDGSNVFTVNVSQPNGGIDLNELNDSYNTNFTLPDMYEENFIIYLRTNNKPEDNSYTVTDVEGNIVLSKNGFNSNTNYLDTLDLPDGCYELSFYDTGNDGLKYWAYTAQGSGYLRF